MRRAIGTGLIVVDPDEVESGRYGTVHLKTHEGTNALLSTGLDGGTGILIAEINETPSPETSLVNKGDKIELAEGNLFFEIHDQGLRVGMTPRWPREKEWLDPSSIARCENHLITLYLEW